MNTEHFSYVPGTGSHDVINYVPKGLGNVLTSFCFSVKKKNPYQNNLMGIWWLLLAYSSGGIEVIKAGEYELAETA